MAEHAKKYYVKALAAIINLEDGVTQLFHRGAAVPGNATQDHIEHLLANDIIAEGDPVGGLEPVRTGDLQTQVTGPDQPDRSGDGGAEADDVDGDGPIPPKSADKATWVAYAVTQGSTEDDANALTKDQLIEQYGTAKPAS